MRLPIILLMALGLVAQTGGNTIPPCRGEECRDDTTGQMRPEQPSWCQSEDGNGFKANCHCKRSCDPKDHGSGCVRYCKTSRCRCNHGCPNT